jgi:hypothetical protein
MSTLAPTYTSVDARPFSTHYVWAEAFLEHPIEKVWEYAVDLPLWMGANHEWEPLAGETGKAGMLWRIWPRRHYAAENGMDPDNVPPPRYHFVGITKVIRHKLLGIEVWTEKGGSYGTAIDPSHRGLDSVLFTDLGNRTNARALFIGVEKPKPEQTLDTSDEEQVAANVMLHFQNLEKLLDGIPLDPPATESYRAEDAA